MILQQHWTKVYPVGTDLNENTEKRNVYSLTETVRLRFRMLVVMPLLHPWFNK
jgi:hypothetical protein